MWRVTYHHGVTDTLHEHLFGDWDFIKGYLGGVPFEDPTEEASAVRGVIGTLQPLPTKPMVEIIRIQKLQLDLGRDGDGKFKDSINIIGNWVK